ncbi:uncharacterized protein BXZ73DRAFT_104035 [Epithele typhae]|uniref:uncharacterized protein n=1 Tax=Epithele typhae TaxID=378194 RepID=UPI002007F105|nr:uncharacterized protein BXZ73DRAFT_104035 [Epithele typhae]KAH9922801.1 hypothetical protein BXZ73DRAFT_104035 [Epithele typhae]
MATGDNNGSVKKERRRSLLGRYSVSTKESPTLPTPIEGKAQTATPTTASLPLLPRRRPLAPQPTALYPETLQLVQLTDPGRSQPTEPARAHLSSLSTTSQGRTDSPFSPPSSAKSPDSRGSFAKMSLGSMLSSLSLSRASSDRGRDEERGRSERQDKDKHPPAPPPTPARPRPTATRPSPAPALTQSDAESDAEGSLASRGVRPRTAFSFSAQSDDESDEGEDESDSDDAWEEGEPHFDEVTEQNTEANALVPATSEQDVPDYLGEGVNVVVPPEPYFPSTLNGGQGRNPRRRKSMKPQDQLPLNTSRPTFQRDRCIISVTQGAPEKINRESGRAGKRYVLASDLSEESRFALEWGIGTVLRDGDELIIVTVVENEGKVDPQIPNPADRATKLRAQQERQALAYILVRQATSLLQRTHLNVSIACQAWHAKNSRHMLLDIVDFYEPVMLIVGSRGLGNLKGILLGSTSHYLIQKCSVPVMVARRRLKRPPRRSAHLKAHRARVSLAQAAVDRVASKVDQDVAKMRSEIARDDERRTEGHPAPDRDDDDDGGDGDDTEVEGDGPGGAINAGVDGLMAGGGSGARAVARGLASAIGEGTENSLGEKVAGALA